MGVTYGIKTDEYIYIIQFFPFFNSRFWLCHEKIMCAQKIRQESCPFFVGEVAPGPKKRHGAGSTAGRNC
jgi:hypothetical protein